MESPSSYGGGDKSRPYVYEEEEDSVEFEEDCATGMTPSANPMECSFDPSNWSLSEFLPPGTALYLLQ